MAVASGAYKKALEGDQTPKQVLVKIDRVTKKFDETIAVDDVSLEINKGEIFAMLGGSGSGKSTLLRMLAGFERPTEGRIFLDGVDITDMPPYERPINMMFQSYALFPHMSVKQNVAFGLKQDGLPKAEIRDRVAEGLALVQMNAVSRAVAPFFAQYDLLLTPILRTAPLPLGTLKWLPVLGKPDS